MSLRVVEIAAGGKDFTSAPLPAITAQGVHGHLIKAMADAGDYANRLVHLTEVDGFELTTIRARDISSVEVLHVEDPGELG